MQQHRKPIRICLAVPCFNPTAAQWTTAHSYLTALKSRLTAAELEVVFVDDGSSSWCEPPSALLATARLVRLPLNLGKGGALRAAVAAMSPDRDVFVFTDFDVPYSIDDLLGVCGSVANGADACIGDRSCFFLKNRIDRITRGFAHSLFRLFVSTIITGGVLDTQCGLKAYDAQAVRLIAGRARINSFLFDLEWLYIALHHKLAVRSWPARVSEEHSAGRLRSMRYARMLGDFFLLMRRVRAREYDEPLLVDWLRRKLTANAQTLASTSSPSPANRPEPIP